MRWLAFCVLVVCASVCVGDEHSHVVSVRGSPAACGSLYFWQYEDHEEVVLWMNTVGPYHNRQETYTFFSLPFCKGPKKEISHYHETLGEALQGVELEFSGLDISFRGTYVFYRTL